MQEVEHINDNFPQNLIQLELKRLNSAHCSLHDELFFLQIPTMPHINAYRDNKLPVKTLKIQIQILVIDINILSKKISGPY